MQAAQIPVDVIMERVPLHNRWASEQWQPAAVLTAEAGDSGASPIEAMAEVGGRRRWRCRGDSVELHPTEAEGYFLNLTAPQPKAFVMWRMYDEGEPPARPVLVTLSYNEAGRFMDGGEKVDGVPLPAALADWMRPFISAHYRPEPRRKVKRNDPFADAAEGRRRR
jgi:hypothetical protein